MEPPTIENWLSQGPRARPIPLDSKFNPDYNLSDLESEYEDELEDFDDAASDDD